MEYFWLAAIALSLFGLYLFKRDSVSIHNAFRQLAAKYNGTVQRGNINYPHLSFSHQDLTIQISAMPHEDGAFTYVHFNTNEFSEDCVFKIISKSMPIKYLEIDKRLKKQKTGIEEVDNNFNLRASSDDYLVALLNSEICKLLLQIDKKYSLEVRYIKDKYADVQNNKEEFRFDLHVDQVLTKVEEYEQLIQAALLLVKQMDKIKR